APACAWVPAGAGAVPAPVFGFAAAFAGAVGSGFGAFGAGAGAREASVIGKSTRVAQFASSSVTLRAIGANATRSAFSVYCPGPRARSVYAPSGFDALTSTGAAAAPSPLVSVSTTPGSGVFPAVTTPVIAHAVGAGCVGGAGAGGAGAGSGVCAAIGAVAKINSVSAATAIEVSRALGVSMVPLTSCSRTRR